MTYGILLIFIPLLLLEAFFAASEIALVSANRRRLHHRAEEGHRDARLALQLLARPEYFLATTLLGAAMAAAANTVLVTAFFLGLFGQAAEVPVMIALPPLILILGEIIPKSIGRQQATLLAERLAPVLVGRLLGHLSRHLGLRRPQPLGPAGGRGQEDRPAALHHPGGPAPGGGQERPGGGPRRARSASSSTASSSSVCAPSRR